jgi:hypothetical protein
VRRSSVAHEKERYLKIPISMGVVDQVGETSVQGTVTTLHFPITLKVIPGGVNPLDSQHLTGLLKKRGHKRAALVGNQDRTRAIAGYDFSSIVSRTDFRRLLCYGKCLRVLREIIYERNYLFLLGVKSYGPVMSIEVI